MRPEQDSSGREDDYRCPEQRVLTLVLRLRLFPPDRQSENKNSDSNSLPLPMLMMTHFCSLSLSCSSCVVLLPLIHSSGDLVFVPRERRRGRGMRIRKEESCIKSGSAGHFLSNRRQTRQEIDTDRPTDPFFAMVCVERAPLSFFSLFSSSSDDLPFIFSIIISMASSNILLLPSSAIVIITIIHPFHLVSLHLLQIFFLLDWLFSFLLAHLLILHVVRMSAEVLLSDNPSWRASRQWKREEEFMVRTDCC